MHSPEQIDLIEQMHGIGSYDRCLVAAKILLRTSRIASMDNVTTCRLERSGIPTALAKDFVELLRPRAPRRSTRGGTILRKAERPVRRTATSR